MTFSKYSPASPRAIHMLRVIVLLALLMSNLAPLAAPSPIAAADLAGTSQPSQAPAPAATNVSATKTDSLLGDADGDGRADPGDTLRYTVAVSNTGTTDASNMVISDTLDPNTSLVAGSVRVSPLALGDTYSALQNTPLVIAAPGLLANDTGTPAPAVTPVTSVATTAGGSVTIASDGSFTYTPPANYTGADSFTYTAGNSAGSDTGAVSITAEGAPLVSSTTPASNAADVPANSNITITFSEPVNVTASAFTLACPVAQPFTVSPPSPATTFTLDPVDTLPVSATCTLTVVAANVSDADTLDPPDQMTADYSFSFTTTDAAPSVTSITPADGAANVAIDSSITVDFSESVNASASSFTLTCGASTQTFALSAAPASSFTLDPISDLPAGANCTVVVLASEIADVDAIDPPDQMAANYSFSFSTDAAPIVASTTPANGATSVAADANIVVDFSESVNAAASTFDLACGGIAQPFSLSASPASSFTLDPTADLPTGASCTVTVVAANVSDVDAADPPDQMAADYSFSFSTDAAPTVTSTTPANGATDLAANTTVVVNFSESVNATTSSFTLTCGGPALSYSLSASPASSFTLTPAAILPAGASCDVTVVAANITDADGIDPPDQMAANYSFSFSTDAAPTVISTSPIDGATGVATNATITVNFSESVNATADSFSFDCGASAQPFTLSPAPAVSFTLDPDSDLPEGTSCIVIVLANQIADADTADPPDQMAADYTFSFTTDPAPSVTSTTPANGAINVALGSNITVNFSESVNATSSSFTLTCGGPSLPFTLSASPASSFTLDPASSFPVNTLCTVTVVAAQVGDVDASDPPDTLAADYVFSFTSIDDTAPNVSSTTPANAATGSAIDTDITINFSEPANLTGSAFTIECPTGTPIAFSNTTGSGPASSFVLNPTADLPTGVTCTVTVVAAQVTDDDAIDPPDQMAADYSFSFTTDAAPSVTSTTPVNGATGVATNATITVNFSESVNATTSSFAVECPAGSSRTFTLSTSPAASFTLTPSAALPAGVVCTVTVLATGITDVDANDPPDTMAANYVFSFSLPPAANDDTYAPQIIGNVGVNTATSSGFSVLTNDLGAGLSISAFDATSAQGGTVALNTSTGTFQYTPPAGFEGADSFTYTISNPTGTDTGTVNLTVSGMIWFVDNNTVTNGNGRLGTPFNSLANFVSGAADDPGDNIFLYESATNYIGPVTLLNNQRLIGQDSSVNLASVAGLTPPADSFALPAMLSANGTITTITSAGNGINLGSGNTLRGLVVSDTVGEDISGTSFGTLTVRDMSLSGAGRALNLNTGTLDAIFASVSSTSGTNNINLNTVDGTLTMSGGALSGATGTAFNVVGGTLSATYGGSIAQGNNAALVGVSGGHSTGTLTFQSGALNATNGTGLQFTNADGIYVFNGTTTLNGGDAGIDIVSDSNGNFTFSSNTSISNPSGIAFNVSQGAGTIAYNGTISKISAGQIVSIQSRTGGTVTLAGNLTCTTSCTGINVASNSGGTIAFSGATNTISTGASAAVTLSNNTSATMNFSGGGLAISTTSGTGFSATGGGTVSVTGAANTIATTSATALNITNTTIGASGLTFRSIASGGGTSTGIILDNTGVSAGLTVTGDGVTAGSGGTIANKTGGDGSTTTGIGIYLNNTRNTSLSFMQLNDFQNFAIRGTTVSGFTLSNSVVNGSNGTNDAIDEGSISFDGLTGSAAITSASISGGWENNFRLLNTSGTLNRITFTSTTIGFNSNGFGNNGIQLEASGAGTTLNATINNGTFLGARADQVSATNNSGATMDFVFTNNQVSNSHPAAAAGGNRIVFAANGPGTYTISGNTIQGSKGSAIFVNAANSSASIVGRIENNAIGLAGTANSGSSEASGIQVESNGGGDHTTLINNNTIRQYNNHGILLLAGDTFGNATNYQATVTNNSVTTPGNINTNFNGIHLNNGTTAIDNFTSCVDIKTNTAVGAGTMTPNNNDIRLRQRQSTTVRLPGYGGANNNDAAVQSFIAGQNSVATVTTSNTVPTGGGFTGGAACSLPPLLAAGGVGPGAQSISQAELSSVTAAAIERWTASGISESERAKLAVVSFKLADLEPRRLGQAGTTQVELDRDAAGWGWFVDATPADDAEFASGQIGDELSAGAGSPARGRMDLLTVVMHELGHVLGHDDIAAAEQPHALMTEALPTGARRAPAVREQGRSVSPSAVTTTPSSVLADIGTLPAGKHVTVIFDVLIASPIPQGVSSVSNQASVSGGNFATLLTDDPATAATADRTVTTLDVLKKLYLPLIMKQPAAAPDLVVTSVTLSPNKTSFTSAEQVQITVVIKNQGSAPTTPFWIDLYLNPARTPAFNLIWSQICSLNPCYGIAWQIAQPLAPGAELMLTSTTGSYAPSYTNWRERLAAGTTDLYVQADSWNPGKTVGASGDSNLANNLFHIGGLHVTGQNIAGIGPDPAAIPTRPAAGAR